MRAKVVIIGAGFGGIKAALGLSKADVDLIVIDKTDHHLFQPLLYQVATAAISSSNIATPIREILRKQKNTTVIMDDVLSIDRQKQELHLLSGTSLSYEYLIVATGAITSYFGHSEWKDHTHDLKTLSDAVKLREHLLFSFELAEKCVSQNEANKYLCFVVVGGGPTGVEMASSIAEISHTSIFKNYKKINPRLSKIYLIEGAEQILPSFPLKLSLKAKKDLEKMGIKVLTSTKVTNVVQDGVYIKDQLIESSNVIWAGGNQASPLLKTLGIALDRTGRAIVDQDLSVLGYPNLFIIGDAAAFQDPQRGILPAMAPIAIQQGKYVAKIIARNIPKEKRKPFKYFDKGNIATIGKAKAVVAIGKFQFSGLFAWFVWAFVHIFYLITFRDRILVMLQWIFLYITDRRSSNIIIHSIDEIEKASEPSFE